MDLEQKEEILIEGAADLGEDRKYAEAPEIPEAPETVEFPETVECPETVGCPETVKSSETADSSETAEATNGWLEQVYSRFEGVPLRALDLFIAACVIAFVAVIAVGVLRARGVL